MNKKTVALTTKQYIFRRTYNSILTTFRFVVSYYCTIR